MKIQNPSVYLNSSGELMMIIEQVPKEPYYCIGFTADDRYCMLCELGKGCEYEKNIYNVRLTSVKSSAVRVKNGTEIQAVILHNHSECKIDTIYTLTGYTGEVVKAMCRHCECLSSDSCRGLCRDAAVYRVKNGQEPDPTQVAIITLSEKKEGCNQFHRDLDMCRDPACIVAKKCHYDPFEHLKKEFDKEESQEELWKEIEVKVWSNHWFAGDLYNYMKKNYVLTRK
jgi:hypothetical protein